MPDNIALCSGRSAQSHATMSFYDILTRMHGGASYLLLAMAFSSVALAVLIAVKPAADAANAGLLKKANIVTAVEILLAGIVLFTGGLAVYNGDWLLSDLWVWLSLTILLFYTVMLIFVTLPSRLRVSMGGSAVKTGLQVGLQMGHVLLLFSAFALMILKPA